MTVNRLLPRRSARLNAPSFFTPMWNLDQFFSELPLVDRPELTSPDLTFAPAVDVEETDTELRLSAELPGLKEGDFEVTTDGDLLTLRGEKKFESTSDENGRKRIERSQGSFERSFRVAWEIDPETVKATDKNGVLELVIPKPKEEVSQVRTIPITTS